MKKYFEDKLLEKVRIHLLLGGSNFIYDDVSEFVENITEFGSYEICWMYDPSSNAEPRVASLRKIGNDLRIYQKSGKYFILNKDGTYHRQLYSSEYIEFSLKECREFQLNKLLG